MIEDGDKAILTMNVEVYRVGELDGKKIALVYIPAIDYSLRVPLSALVPAWKSSHRDEQRN